MLSAFRSRVGQTRGLRMCSDYFNFKKLIRNQRIVGQAQKMRGRKQKHFRTKSTRKPPFSGAFGAGNQTRTDDLLITNQLLYRLSYSSLSTCTRGDIEITNQLLYRLSYTSIVIFDSAYDTILSPHRQHHFQLSGMNPPSSLCILQFVLLQVFLQYGNRRFFVFLFKMPVNRGKIEKLCRCISSKPVYSSVNSGNFFLFFICFYFT